VVTIRKMVRGFWLMIPSLINLHIGLLRETRIKLNLLSKIVIEVRGVKIRITEMQMDKAKRREPSKILGVKALIRTSMNENMITSSRPS
jgi:hypothetical protein